MKDLTQVYRQLRQASLPDNIYYAGLSDGKAIYIHDHNSIDADSLTWEVLHLTSHLIQWHMEANVANRLGLEFFGKRAREYATRDFATEAHELDGFLRYELETNRLCLAIAKQISRTRRRRKIDLVLARYCANDLRFILQYYRDRRVSSQASFSMPGVADLERRLVPVGLPKPSEIRVRKLPFFSVPVLLESRS